MGPLLGLTAAAVLTFLVAPLMGAVLLACAALGWCLYALHVVLTVFGCIFKGAKLWLSK